ncbi:uncharacterized protein ARMOST_14767 [Armillaria ostoyae]|uniref:Uncharacterized protein n=1 Tax=Armillaria ostoyae TaxID=47428 RepID=A0A284RRJ0_ARMOS|nr:uncharacterized protein ARMOST_14767 [Armillaria ostoyae]
MIAAVAEEIALSDFFLLVCRYSFTWCLFSTRLRYETLRTPFLLSFFFLELVNKPARQCQIASTSKRYERRRVSLGSAGSQAHVSTALSVKIRLQASNIQDSYGGHTGECITRDGWNGATDTTHGIFGDDVCAAAIYRHPASIVLLSVDISGFRFQPSLSTVDAHEGSTAAVDGAAYILVFRRSFIDKLCFSRGRFEMEADLQGPIRQP